MTNAASAQNGTVPSSAADESAEDPSVSIEYSNAAGLNSETNPNRDGLSRPLSVGFVRPIYSVGVTQMSWTKPDGSMRVSAKAHYPINPQAPCPVVIFSHGLGGAPERFRYLGDMWASRGVVAVFLHHPETDESQWRGNIRAMPELKELYRRYWSARDRALAIRFTIDRLCEMGDQPGVLSGIMDVSRLGVAGNDLGALGALLVAGQLPPDNGLYLKDDRVKAVLALSPTVYCSAEKGKVVYADVSVPFMSVGGTNDDGIVGTTKAWQRRIPFDAMSNNDRFHVTLNGGDHLVYSGHLRSRKQANDSIYQNAIKNVSTVFWSAYLQNDETALHLLESTPPALMSRVTKLESKVH